MNFDPVNETFLAIINPAAGGGRCGQRVAAALDLLRADGIKLETAETRAASEATQIARDAYRNGYRKFLAVGGDGTTFEIVNGLFPDALDSSGSNDSKYDALAASTDAPRTTTPTLGFLP